VPSGNCTRKATAGLTYFYLQTATDVVPLMSALLTIQFSATLRAYNDANGAANWDLQIDDMRTGSEGLSPQDRTKIMH
jgi:hypothetical protein